MSEIRDGRVYLYLARRDKTGVKILAILSGRPRMGRVLDPKALDLPAEIAPAILQCCHDNRMFWEPWVDAAPTFASLSKRLKAQGYTGIPMRGQPLVTYLPGMAVNTRPAKCRQTMLRPAK